MSMRNNYKQTILSCFTGYIVQAIVNNFLPLLFLTFQRTYDIPLSKITLLVTFNFLVQLVVDLVSAGFVDKIGYRVCLVMADILSAAGFIPAGVSAGDFAQPLYRNPDLCDALRDRRRPDGGPDQPGRGGLPVR